MADFERHVGELPWGWWLRAVPHGLEDANGRVWRSVRNAFWEGELGFPPVHFAPEQHELMLRVMTSIQEGWFGRESKHDVFNGDMQAWRGRGWHILDFEEPEASCFGQTLVVDTGSVPYRITWSPLAVPEDWT